MNDDFDDEPTPHVPARWHESIAAVIIVALVAAACTAPCWLYVLALGVTR